MRLTQREKLKICREVNSFKMKEMEVHPSSMKNIHILEAVNLTF